MNNQATHPRAMRAIAAAAATALLSLLSACHTTEGAGKDIKNLGQNIQDSAEKHSD